jgi:hypothetical protein
MVETHKQGVKSIENLCKLHGWSVKHDLHEFGYYLVRNGVEIPKLKNSSPDVIKILPMTVVYPYYTAGVDTPVFYLVTSGDQIPPETIETSIGVAIKVGGIKLPNEVPWTEISRAISMHFTWGDHNVAGLV